MKSKGKIKEMTFGASVKLSYKFQTMDASFFITKEFDVEDESINWDEEKELLKSEVYELLQNEAGEIQGNLVEIAKAMK